MSIVKRFGRTRGTLVAVTLVAAASIAVGLAWAGQESTVRLCEEDDPLAPFPLPPFSDRA